VGRSGRREQKTCCYESRAAKYSSRLARGEGRKHARRKKGCASSSRKHEFSALGVEDAGGRPVHQIENKKRRGGGKKGDSTNSQRDTKAPSADSAVGERKKRGAVVGKTTSGKISQ